MPSRLFIRLAKLHPRRLLRSLWTHDLHLHKIRIEDSYIRAGWRRGPAIRDPCHGMCTVLVGCDSEMDKKASQLRSQYPLEERIAWIR